MGNKTRYLRLLKVLLCVSISIHPPLSTLHLRAQGDLSSYKFLKLDDNHMHYDSTSSSMHTFAERWQHLFATGQGNLNIVHIGGSHVQAGTLTETIRLRLLAEANGMVGPRGMLFPYSAAAKCNNPPDYRVHCVQPVTLTRCVYKEPEYTLGLCGIAVTAKDQPTEIQIIINEPDVDFATTRIVLLGHSEGGVVPCLRTAGGDHYPSYFDNVTDRYIFNLREAVDSFNVVLPCREGCSFTVSGLYLGNRNPGVSYHSIGVNGAAVPDYLRCPNFVRDLRLLHPDAVVFGIGINDASGPNFDTAVFRRNYLQLIDSVRAVNPNCALIFITNNDSFRKTGRRKYTVNKNGELARDVFFRLADETGGAVWDQFEVMGGLKSMEKWQKASLARPDKVHFTREGYRLVGNLFADALLEVFRSYTVKQSPEAKPAAEATKEAKTDARNPQGGTTGAGAPFL